jgi:DNA (cytosine-5)-methyltransferase 1
LLQRKAKPTAIDLFSGAGGMSLGLSHAGFDIVAAIDNDPVAVATYVRNLGHHVICRPIEQISASELLSRAGLKVGECTVLAGGPPCQGFSLQRRGDRIDPRNDLVFEFIRLVEGVRPLFFVMENVGGLLSKHGTPFLREIEARASAVNYKISIGLLNAADYGVPQTRKRAFLIGQMEGVSSVSFQFPGPTIDRAMTVRDAIWDLPSPPEDGSKHHLIENHYRESRLSKLNIERIKYVPPGGGRDDLPPHLQLECHKNTNHRHKDVYGRLQWDAPAGTITARFDSFTRGRFAHPEEHRSITIREGARLQTFPDNFVFEGNREDQARQVGNAVPPRLAETLGRSILDVLKTHESLNDIIAA